jgi:aminoglycoside 3-N-acetyltransferase
MNLAAASGSPTSGCAVATFSAKRGNADARLCDARDLVAVAVEHLTVDPLIFLCSPGGGCEECDDARASIPSTDR